MSLEESLLYPLILLGIGSGITMFLVPKFTDRYSKKRHETEIKHDFIVKITELHEVWFSAITEVTEPLIDELDNEKIDKQLTEIIRKGSVIQSLLSFYFSNESLFSVWDNYEKSLDNYFRYLSFGNEHSLTELSKSLNTDKIKSLKGIDFRNSVEDRIIILFELVLVTIENSEVIR